MNTIKNISKELTGTNLIPVILAILKTGDSFGFEIMQKIKKTSPKKIIWKEGSLYPILRKMEKSGLIKSYWNIKDYDKHRKYYKIVSKGQKVFEKEKNYKALSNPKIAELWEVQTFSI